MWHQLLLGGEHFSVLAPSRFGYVGTQLEAGHHGSRAELTLSQQAEAINDLLHALDLNKVTFQIALDQSLLIDLCTRRGGSLLDRGDQVGVVGIGGGGPLAMELVKNYPHKFWAFVLLGAVTRKWQPPEEESFAYRPHHCVVWA
jgi:pimeloyl-ACP methyl ester carboxylesterase